MGIDVSKGYADFVILSAKKGVVEKNFQLDDTFDGHQILCSVMDNFFKQHETALLHAGLESTGGYENNWYHLLFRLQQQYGLKVARVNPIAVKSQKNLSMERNNNDRISARYIAEYMIGNPQKIFYSYEDLYAPARRLWNFIRRLKKQQISLLKQLESAIYAAQPELSKYCKESTPLWVLHLLSRYPTAAQLARAHIKELTQIPYVTEPRARLFIESAKKSVASLSDEAADHCIKGIVTEILHLKETIKLEIKTMLDSYKFPEIDLITSFTGIGQYTALGLLLEIGAIERFSSHKALACFFGLHPVERKSGDGKLKPRMSKMGRSEPRWLLFNVVKTAIIHNDLIRELYEEYQEKGKCKMSAIGILMHKVIRIVYSMLKNRQEFNPALHKRHRKNVLQEKSMFTFEHRKDRRYQSFDNSAHIEAAEAKETPDRESRN